MALDAALESASTRESSRSTLALGLSWCGFQFALIAWPQQPMVSRPQVDSPLAGPKGNLERFVWARKGGREG